MLKNPLSKRLKRLEAMLSDVSAVPSIYEEQKQRKYTLDDWAIEDIRKVVFPEGRDCFDPDDEALMDKWNDTYWLSRDFLKLLSVEELSALRDWMEKRKLEEVMV